MKASNLEAEFVRFAKEKIVPSVHKALCESLGIKSVVEVEANGKSKFYGFRGFGCGFTYVEYDKRSKKAKQIEKLARDYRKQVWEQVEDMFQYKVIRELEENGTPIRALLFQDINCQNAYYQEVADFMKEQGAKNVYVVSRLD